MLTGRRCLDLAWNERARETGRYRSEISITSGSPSAAVRQMTSLPAGKDNPMIVHPCDVRDRSVRPKKTVLAEWTLFFDQLHQSPLHRRQHGPKFVPTLQHRALFADQRPHTLSVA